jgi:hypothetical protein
MCSRRVHGERYVYLKLIKGWAYLWLSHLLTVHTSHGNFRLIYFRNGRMEKKRRVFGERIRKM